MLVLVSMLVVTATWAQEKPNIVFIFMDNFGYGELGVYGGGITRGGPHRASIPWPRKECGSPISMSKHSVRPPVQR